MESAKSRIQAMTPEAKADLLRRFNLYTTDRHNGRAALTVGEVDLLVAIAEDR
jgi:hypothetical protein